MDILKAAILIFLSSFLLPNAHPQAQDGMAMTVLGPIPSSEMGLSLIHEHVLVDFIGADQTGNHRWESAAVIRIVQPFLKEAQDLGVKTLVECTPAYIGRDPQLLKELAEANRIYLITNTGYYGASDNKFIPAHAYSESAEQLAERWIREWRDGIDGTGIRPGFIKTGVNGGSL